MRTLFTITEQEKKQILKKHNLLKEAAKLGCIQGTCKNGKGIFVKDTSYGGIKTTETMEGDFGETEGVLDGNGIKKIDGVIAGRTFKEIFEGTFSNNFITNGKRTIETKNSVVVDEGRFVSDYLEGNGKKTKTSPNFEVLFDGAFKKDNLTSGIASYKIDGVSFKIQSNEIEIQNLTYYYTNPTITTSYGKTYYGKMIYVYDARRIVSFEGSDGKKIQDFLTHIKEEEKTYSTDNQVATDNTQPTVNKVEPETKTNTETPSTKPVITDDMRAKWQGCGVKNDPIFWFNGGLGGSKDYGYLTEIPELGNAKFEGIIDGKNIKVNACFDKFKLISTHYGGETGDRGRFDGYYYTLDKTSKTFQGDESKSNKFQFGVLKNSPEYKFHDDKWEYSGNFVDGLMEDIDGDITFSDKSTYYGSFVGGKISGQGRFTFANGRQYSGIFEQIENNNGVTYSVILKNGLTISDVLKEKDLPVSAEVNTDKKTSIGIIDSFTVQGSTLYKTEIEFPQEDESVEKESFAGLLPGVVITLTKTDLNIDVEEEKKVYTVKSDDNGVFKITNVLAGEYEITANFPNDESPYFSFKRENLSISENKSFRITLSITDKGKKEEKRIISLNSGTMDEIETEEDYLNLFLKPSLMAVPLSKSKEFEDLDSLTDGQYEKNYGRKATIKQCVDFFDSYIESLKLRNADAVEDALLKKAGEVDLSKKVIQSCWSKYKEDIKKDIKKDDLSFIRNPGGGDMLKYKVYLKENKNFNDIYMLNDTMSNSMKNIVREHARRKKRKSLVEGRIIENRLNFIVENQFYGNSLNVTKLELENEKRNLIKTGYNSKLVNETFIDVMNTLFSSEGKNVVSDIRKRLGDKIATAFKFEMLNSIFNEITDTELETALKKNDPDLISGPITDKIIQRYKTKYPDDKMLTLVLDSTNREQLKNKITDLIKDEFGKTVTNMDSMLNKIRSVVSGG